MVWSDDDWAKLHCSSSNYLVTVHGTHLTFVGFRRVDLNTNLSTRTCLFHACGPAASQSSCKHSSKGWLFVASFMLLCIDAACIEVGWISLLLGWFDLIPVQDLSSPAPSMWMSMWSRALFALFLPCGTVVLVKARAGSNELRKRIVVCCWIALFYIAWIWKGQSRTLFFRSLLMFGMVSLA